MNRILDSFRHFTMKTVDRQFETGESIIAEASSVGQRKDGRQYENRYVLIWSFSEGTICREDGVFRSAAAAKLVGAASRIE